MNDSESNSIRSASDTRSIEPNIAVLLSQAGCSSPTFTLQSLAGGRNNRTYRVRTNAADLLLKWYFSHQGDKRDRLGTEFEFGSCLWRHGIRQIAQPLAADRSAGLGLYQFLAGRPTTASDITPAHHDQAIAFWQSLATLSGAPDARRLPAASEACFSLAAHVSCIDERLRRLARVSTDTATDREMIEFMRLQLRPAFEHQRDELKRWAVSEMLDMQAELGDDDRCLSPSDFGFHNCLLQEDGSLRFVDFEYAGWDDAAKLVGDFFCQIEVPALASEFDGFLGNVAQMFRNPGAVAQRARRLFPLYQVKWCTIVLNDFLPTGSARRSFNEPRASEARRADQLSIARGLFQRIGCIPG